MNRVRKDGVPVVDATADVTIYVTAPDVACASQKDPCACAVAQAVKRTVGDQAEAEVWRSFAYVKAPREDGSMAWTRFRLSPATRKRIVEFDLTGVAPVAGYVLKAPTPTQTLEYRRKQRAKSVRRPGSRRVRTGGQVTLGSNDVRNGAGHVHHRVAV